MPKEDDINVIKIVSKYAKNISEENVTGKFQKEESEKMFNALCELKNPDILGILSTFAYNEKQFDQVFSNISKSELSEECKCEILKAHFRNPLCNLETKLEDLEKYGKKSYQHICEINLPDWDTKTKIWNSYLTDKRINAASEYFWSIDQFELLLPFTKKFFMEIIEVFGKQPIPFAVKFFYCMKPKIYNDTVLKQFKILYQKIGVEKSIASKVEENQGVLKRLVEKEIELRTKILKTHEKYMAYW